MRRSRRSPRSSSGALPGRPLTFSALVPSHTPEWYAHVERLVRDARQVRFISMGLQILREGKILDILVERARQGLTEVTVCLANPYSPDVIDRLVEEEMSQTQPQIGRQGVVRNISSLLDHLDKDNNPERFRVLLFEHYPTVATYLVDHEVFVVPYTYQRLGHQAPLLHMRDDGTNEVAAFFVANAERILRDAVPARDVVASQPDRRYLSEDWFQACVSIVPDAGEPLYQFGSHVIGFDLRSGSQQPASNPELTESVGEAAQQGFHAPLAGPLCFVNEAAICRIAAELTLLAEEFPRLTLVRPRVEDRTSNLRGIVLRCEDPTGVAEALHGELVSRVNKRAVSSGFLLARATRPGGLEPASNRSNLMIHRYSTPYVLNRFDVNFCLCAEPPADPAARRAMVERLEEACREQVPREPLDVDRIYLLVRRPGEPHWSIYKAYRLNGN